MMHGLAKRIKQLRASLPLFVTSSFLISAGSLQAQASSEMQANSDLIRTLCSKDIVMLGEASHGDGATFERKAQIVLELIEHCDFRLIFFEAPTYDYLALDPEIQTPLRETLPQDLREDPDPRLLRSAPLWSWTQEFFDFQSSLVPFMEKGLLVQGGLDDQINAGTWALENLATRLKSYTSSPPL